jgi:hypothetical protein
MGTDTYHSIRDGKKLIWRIDELISNQPIMEDSSEQYINAILNRSPWFHSSDYKYTVKDIVDITQGLHDGRFNSYDFSPEVNLHSQRIINSNLNKPIVLNMLGKDDFDIIDGYHRIAKTHLENIPKIKVVKLSKLPKPHIVEDFV